MWFVFIYFGVFSGRNGAVCTPDGHAVAFIRASDGKTADEQETGGCEGNALPGLSKEQQSK